MASKFSSAAETLEEYIKCPICYEFICLLLPHCQHHICEKCVDGIRKRNRGKFVCPQCREECTGDIPKFRLAENLRNEHFMTDVAKVLGAKEDGSLKGCQLCNNGKVDMRCKKCKKFTCYRCSKRNAQCGGNKHECEDLEDIESDSYKQLEAWKKTKNDQITSKQNRLQQLLEETHRLEKEIVDMTSISEAASEIWKNERDTVERIVFVEQLSLKPDVLPKLRANEAQQPITKVIDTHHGDIIKSYHMNAINNVIKPPHKNDRSHPHGKTKQPVPGSELIPTAPCFVPRQRMPVPGSELIPTAPCFVPQQQVPQVLQKRDRRPLSIVNPDTNETVNTALARLFDDL